MIDKTVYLCIPDATHEEAYARLMDRWEKTETNIQPELLRRYGSGGKKVPYTKWLEWCEDDRTTGSMLADHIPCTLYFLVHINGEILGCVEINHRNTQRGHIHIGVAPWQRRKGYANAMIALALERCREMGMTKVQCVPFKDSIGAVHAVVNNGGIFLEEFCENGVWSERYEIDLECSDDVLKTV